MLGKWLPFVAPASLPAVPRASCPRGLANQRRLEAGATAGKDAGATFVSLRAMERTFISHSLV